LNRLTKLLFVTVNNSQRDKSVIVLHQVS